MSYQVNNSAIIYEGPIFNLRKDKITLPNRKSIVIDIIEHRNAVTMLPIDQKGNIWFIRQYRHPTRQELLELPAGVMETDKTPEIDAQREIREEIGMRANIIEAISSCYLAPGYSTEFMHFFLAYDLVPDALPGDENEFLSIEKIDYQKAYQMLNNNEFHDAKTLIALLTSKKRLIELGWKFN
jgi:ADP-ribose pyrophosphatase